MVGFFEQDANDSNEHFAETVSYTLVETNEEVRRIADEFSNERVLAVDTENTGIDPHLGRPILLQIATVEHCYVFRAYAGLDLSPLKGPLEDPAILKVLFQAKYDWKWLAVHYDIRMTNIFCLQIAERLLTVGLPGAHRRPSLAFVVRKYFGVRLKKDTRKGFINRDPIADPLTEEEFRYSAADAALLPSIMYVQLELLTESHIDRAAKLEFDALPVLADAEVTGVFIDEPRWRSLLSEANKKRDAVAREIYGCFDAVIAQKNLFGLPTFNLASTAQLMRQLKKLGFELSDTEEATLKRYKNKHKVFGLLLRYRGLNKLVTSYGEKLLGKINKKTGRLHCEFNQVEADTGRMSSSEPNLQQVPGFNPRDPDSLDFRGCFTASPGKVLVTADYSQQELRILADLSGDPTFYRAYTTLDEKGREMDIHALTASDIFNISYEQVLADYNDEDKGSAERKKAKVVNFLIPYGGGAYTLAEGLGITEDAAQEIIDTFFIKYGKIKAFLDRSADFAVSRGYIKTISGRRRYLPLPPPEDPDFKRARAGCRRRGKNTPVQGSGADVTKQGLAFVHERLVREGLDAKILMVVHDELVVEVREDQAEQAAKIVEEEMVRGFTHFFKRIPMRVDAHIGPTWKK